MIYISLFLITLYLILFMWLSFKMIEYNASDNNNFFPNVSIIISAHNENQNIINLLFSLTNQTYPSNYEIIIADDRSTDNTKKNILNYVKKYSFIKLIEIVETPIGWGNKKWALHQCIEKAENDIILQTDADCIPNTNWIQSMVNEFSNPDVIFVSGAAPLIDSENIFSEYYRLDSLAQDALSASAIVNNFCFSCTGRNMGFLKQIFLDIDGYGGIEHYISGDDDLLIQKFANLNKGKIKFNFNADSIVQSKPPDTINHFLNQRIRYASKGFDYYKLDTTVELKILLPFLYICNVFCLISLIIFMQKNQIIYLLPILLKSFADYWLCINFFDKIKESFSIKHFIILSLIHPIYVSSLGLLSPFMHYQWKNND